jgi:hypothetical protein
MRTENYTALLFLIAIWISGIQNLYAQEPQDSTRTKTDTWRYIDGDKTSEKSADSIYLKLKIKELKDEHEIYAFEQRKMLRQYVRDRNERFDDEKRKISDPTELKQLEAEFEADKKAYAEEVATRINAHKEMTDSQIAYLKVTDEVEDNSTLVGVSLEGIHFKKGNSRRYSRELDTESNFTFAFGYTFANGDNLDINDFSYGNNNYFGLGYQWSTAISKNQKWRFNYGLLYQSYGIELNGNRIFSPNTSETQVVNFGRPSEKRKFRQDQLVIPLHLEFGGAERREYDDGRIRYQRYNKWKGGIGGYAGINLSSRLKLKYENNGRDIKETSVNAFDTNILAYGVDAYVGYDFVVAYVRAGLNPIFKSGSVDAQYVSFGIRFQ